MGNWDVKQDDDGERELLDRAVKALETEFATKTCNKQIASEDAISRSSIKQKLQEHHDFYVKAYGGFSNLPQNDKSRVDEINACIAMVVNEPPVTPKQRTGHWIECEEEVKCFCSECKEISDYPTQFCPNCGARMVEPQEREDIC